MVCSPSPSFQGLSGILMCLTIVGHVATAALGAGNGSSAGAALGPGPKCKWPIHYGMVITKGVYIRQSELGDAVSCCEVAGTIRGVRGWTWNPPNLEAIRNASHTERGAAALPPLARVGAGPMPPVVYNNALYHVHGKPSTTNALSDFPPGSEITLLGKVTENGGTVAVHSLNKSFADTHIQFSAAWSPSPQTDPFWFMNLTMLDASTKASTHVGWATSMSNAAGSPATTLEWYGDVVTPCCVNPSACYPVENCHVAAYLSLGPNPPPPIGKCQFYSTVEETTVYADKRVASGGPPPFPPTAWST